MKLAVLSLVLLLSCTIAFAIPADFRPPAVPIVVMDPLTEVWSVNDTLTDGWTQYDSFAFVCVCVTLLIS
jgi:hypothetical protein